MNGNQHGRVGVLVRTGDQFPVVNFRLVGTATLSRPCLGPSDTMNGNQHGRVGVGVRTGGKYSAESGFKICSSLLLRRRWAIA